MNQAPFYYISPNYNTPVPLVFIKEGRHVKIYKKLNVEKK